jgi:BirA family biotin operon repressor/biotin-[acetyl-CoA-carboxylase] ligase
MRQGDQIRFMGLAAIVADIGTRTRQGAAGMMSALAGRILAMLDTVWLARALPVEGLGRPLHVYESLESTNATALELARAGAPHGTLVVADEQTAGRGRGGRRWLTPPGAALAFSLVLRPQGLSPQAVGGLNVLGALAVVEASARRELAAQIKWPNDVLVGGRKVAGILVEAAWQGEQLEHVVLGIGVNVLSASLPAGGEFDFPATSLESAARRPLLREPLLVDILGGIGRWYPAIGTEPLREMWQQHLAFLGEWVSLTDGSQEIRGRVCGVESDGRLLLEEETGRTFYAPPSGSHLRPVDRSAR